MFLIKIKRLMTKITNFLYLKIHSSQYNKELLEKVLDGIPDVIGVYNTDHTIILYNQAGYDFHSVTRDEIKEKKCYEMLYRGHQCLDCPVDSAIKLKKVVRKEKYIYKIDKYMEYCCNPVIDRNGKVVFVVEQLRDISERKQLEEEIKESGKNYRKIVNLSPDAIVISMEGIIVLANQQAMKLMENPIGGKLENYILPSYQAQLKKGFNYIIREEVNKYLIDCKMIRADNSVFDAEISSSFVSYKGRQAILSSIRDISERNKEMNAAVKYQLTGLQKSFPIPEKAGLDTVYIPAKIISGDFYSFHKISEDLVIGILSDVSGKGVSAALSISAFYVLCNEVALLSHNPSEMLYLLNKKVGKYLGERYIAACCFSFDFKRNEAKIVGAGINEFIYQRNTGEYFNTEIKGPFLGMFDDSTFDEQLIEFEKGDKFYFFTDGLENIMSLKETNIVFGKIRNISEITEYFRDSINDMLTDIEGNKDDCTLLALEIK